MNHLKFFAVSVVAVCLTFVIPAVAGAQQGQGLPSDEASLRAMIEQLNLQISQLEKEFTALGGSATTSDQTNWVPGNQVSIVSSSVIFVAKNPALAGPIRIIKGSIKTKIGSYVLKSTLSESASVSNLSFQIQSSNFQNLQVYIVAAGQTRQSRQFGPTQARVEKGGTYSFAGAPFTISRISSTTIDVYADVLSSAFDGNTPRVTRFSGCSAIGASSRLVGCSGAYGQDVTVLGQPELTVTPDASPPQRSRKVSMGSDDVTLAVFRMVEMKDIEPVAITDITVVDNVESVNSVKPSFYNLTLWKDNVAIASSGSAYVRYDGKGYEYTFNFYKPIVIPRADSVSLVLKGDVASLGSSGATPNSLHKFSFERGDAFGYYSNSTASIKQVSFSVAYPTITVVKSKLNVSTAPLGSRVNRAPLWRDDLGLITLKGDSSVYTFLNTLTVTFTGTAMDKRLVNSADLIAPTGESVTSAFNSVTSSTSLCSEGSSECTKMWFFGRGVNDGWPISPGGSSAFKLRIDSTNISGCGPNCSTNLSASIYRSVDVSYDPGGLILDESAVPISINSVSFLRGVGTWNPTSTTPSITVLSPSSGVDGDLITIYGKNLTYGGPNFGTQVVFFQKGEVKISLGTNSLTFGEGGTSLSFRVPQGTFSIAPGVYQIEVDNDKGRSNQVSFTVAVSSTVATSTNQFPVITSIFGPATLKVNQKGIFTVNASDRDSYKLWFAANYQDGSIVDTQNKTTKNRSPLRAIFNHAWKTPGKYEVVFEVADELGGQATKNKIVTVTDSRGWVPGNQSQDQTQTGVTAPNRTPVLSAIAGPSTLTANRSGSWRITGYDPDGTQLTYAITWGDNTTSKSSGRSSARGGSIVKAFSHNYRSPGTYTIQFAIEDAKGEKSAIQTRTVTVSGSVPLTPGNRVNTYPGNQVNTYPGNQVNTYTPAPATPVIPGNRVDTYPGNQVNSYTPSPAAPSVNSSRRDQINNLYKTLLNREGDAGGLNYWTGTSYSIDYIRNAIMKTAEYKSLHPSTPAPVTAPSLQTPTAPTTNTNSSYNYEYSPVSEAPSDGETANILNSLEAILSQIQEALGSE